MLPRRKLRVHTTTHRQQLQVSGLCPRKKTEKNFSGGVHVRKCPMRFRLRNLKVLRDFFERIARQYQEAFRYFDRVDRRICQFCQAQAHEMGIEKAKIEGNVMPDKRPAANKGDEGGEDLLGRFPFQSK